MTSSEMSLMGMKPEENSTRLQIDAWLGLFDTTIYCYITISILMFTIYYTFIEQFRKILSIQKKGRRVVRRRIRKTTPNFLFVKNSIGIGMTMISKILQATIGIYSFEGATVKTRIMITFISFSLFFLISWYIFEPNINRHDSNITTTLRGFSITTPA